MTQRHPVHGLWCAMLTPLDRDGGVDHARFARHAHWLLAQGVDGVAPFGTTGEGQSFSTAERTDGHRCAARGGHRPRDRIVAATGAAALTDTIALTRHGVQSGCAGCLVLPPFFFKDVSDDGLYAWYARLIEAVADPRLRVFLYHIPQVSGTPLSVDLVARLAAAFPGIIAGVKDSAGDWAHTSALLARVPQLAILVGHEPHLPRLLRAGGAGTICGVANVYPGARPRADVARRDGRRRSADRHLHRHRLPAAFLPAFKSIVAARTGDPGMARGAPAAGRARRRRAHWALARIGAGASAGLPVTPERQVRAGAERGTISLSNAREETMADQDRWGDPRNPAPPPAAGGPRRGGARRRPGRRPAGGARAGHVRLEALQGREDRGVPGQEPARRPPHQVPQGIRGPDRHHRRLGDDPRAAAAAEGRHRVQFGQHELRRDRDFVSRAEAAVRQEQVAGRRPADDGRQVARRSQSRLRRFREGRAHLRDAGRRPHRQPAAEPRPVGRLLQQGAVRRQGHRLSEDVRGDGRRRGAPQRSGQGRVRVRRRAASRTPTFPCGRASCWATAARSSTPRAS